MSRNKRRKGYQGHFVQLHDLMLKGNAWRSLSPAAKLIYIELKRKYNGRNNGSIKLGYSELQDIPGLSSDTTRSRAFQELETKGWIRRRNCGGMYRRRNEYEFTGKYDPGFPEHLTFMPWPVPAASSAAPTGPKCKKAPENGGLSGSVNPPAPPVEKEADGSDEDLQDRDTPKSGATNAKNWS